MLARVRHGLRLEDVLVLRLHHWVLHLAGRGLPGHLKLALGRIPMNKDKVIICYFECRRSVNWVSILYDLNFMTHL